MCKGVCEGSCSAEAQTGCPIIQILEKLSPDTTIALDDTWKHIGNIMEREEATLPLARKIAKHMI